MVRDLDIIKNEKYIYEKRFIIWGAGAGGKELFIELVKKTDNIVFIDSDNTKSGIYCGKPVYGPERLADFLDDDNSAIVISALSMKLQNAMLEQIFSLGGGTEYDIYTKFAVELALKILEAKEIEKQKEEIQILNNKLNLKNMEISSLRFRVHLLEQIFAAEMSEKVVFVYSSKKVASSSICLSAYYAGIYALHTHYFLDRQSVIPEDVLKMFMKRKHGKVITLVRDPIARQISLLWHILGDNAQTFINRYGTFDNIEKNFLSVSEQEDEFEWFKSEMESMIGINVYDYPFDCESGYSIIEKDGISLLLLKMEKLASLENVIASFLEADSFKLYNDNVTENKTYRFAYQDYLKQAVISPELIKHYYCGNKYMEHFYTKKEILGFRNRWENNIRLLETENGE